MKNKMDSFRLDKKKNFLRNLFCIWTLILVSFFFEHSTLYADVGTLDDYDIVWHSPSRDCSGSMPVGNGDIGLNVWVEESGDLLFYIGKTDSWGDNARLLKVGRLRISLDPNPLRDNAAFRQRLNLEQGTIEICYGAPDNPLELSIWVDANNPVIHVDMDGPAVFSAAVQIELWRTKAEQLESIEIGDVYQDWAAPNRQHAPTIVESDTLLTGQRGRRFPAFWGPNYDWVPDQDHGGILMKTLQSMLIQTDGKKILLFPAWPRQWDVNFKLHAPYQTIIKGRLRNGKIEQLEVNPPERKQDIQLMGFNDDDLKLKSETSVKRYGSIIEVRKEKLDEYKALHAAVWPDVLAMIKECNIRNYSIFLRQIPDGHYYLFSYFEYIGNDFESDMAKMSADPTTQKWWDLCEPCQKPLPDRADGQWWASMDEVFHCD